VAAGVGIVVSIRSTGVPLAVHETENAVAGADPCDSGQVQPLRAEIRRTSMA